MPTTITMKDVSVSSTGVTVSGDGGKALAKSLIQKNALTLAELASTFGFIHPEEIFLTEDGAIELRSKGVVEKLSAAAHGGGDFFDTNCSCGKF